MRVMRDVCAISLLCHAPCSVLMRHASPCLADYFRGHAFCGLYRAAASVLVSQQQRGTAPHGRHTMAITSTNRPWIAERTAEINASADAISALNVGDGVSVSIWTDVDAYTIIKKTAKTITLRADTATLINGDDLVFHVGGFAAHCSNQRVQRYSYDANPGGLEIKISLRVWADDEGKERRKWKKSGTKTFEQGGNAYAGRGAFRDYNF